MRSWSGSRAIRSALGSVLIVVGVVAVGAAISSANESKDLTITAQPVPLDDGVSGIPLEQAKPSPKPSDEQATFAANTVLAALRDASGGASGSVQSVAPWSDGFGNPLGVAVDVSFERDVTFPDGLPLPAATGEDDGGGFQPSPERPFEVVTPTEPLVTDRVTAFFDLRTNELAFVRVVKFPNLDLQES